MNGQIGGAPPATGQSERSMHVFPLAIRSAGVRAQLSIAMTLKAVRQITRNKKKMDAIEVNFGRRILTLSTIAGECDVSSC